MSRHIDFKVLYTIYDNTCIINGLPLYNICHHRCNLSVLGIILVYQAEGTLYLIIYHRSVATVTIFMQEFCRFESDTSSRVSRGVCTMKKL